MMDLEPGMCMSRPAGFYFIFQSPLIMLRIDVCIVRHAYAWPDLVLASVYYLASVSMELR